MKLTFKRLPATKAFEMDFDLREHQISDLIVACGAFSLNLMATLDTVFAKHNIGLKVRNMMVDHRNKLAVKLTIIPNPGSDIDATSPNLEEIVTPMMSSAMSKLFFEAYKIKVKHNKEKDSIYATFDLRDYLNQHPQYTDISKVLHPICANIVNNFVLQSTNCYYDPKDGLKKIHGYPTMFKITFKPRPDAQDVDYDFLAKLLRTTVLDELYKAGYRIQFLPPAARTARRFFESDDEEDSDAGTEYKKTPTPAPTSDDSDDEAKEDDSAKAAQGAEFVPPSILKKDRLIGKNTTKVTFAAEHEENTYPIDKPYLKPVSKKQTSTRAPDSKPKPP